MPKLDDKILTLRELSAYLKIRESTLYKIVKVGTIPARKIRKHRRFDWKTIDAWMAKSTLL